MIELFIGVQKELASFRPSRPFNHSQRLCGLNTGILEYWKNGKGLKIRFPQHSTIPSFQGSRQPLGSKWAPA